MKFVKSYIIKYCNDEKIDELIRDKLNDIKQQDWENLSKKIEDLENFKLEDVDYLKIRKNIYDNFITILENNFPDIDINKLPVYVVSEMLNYIIPYTIEYGVMVELNEALGIEYYSTESLTESIIDCIEDIINNRFPISLSDCQKR